MRFSEKLRTERRKKGFTQTQIAEKLGISQSAYSKYETGVHEPNVSQLIAILKVLEIRSEILLDQ